ncbi:hypothetical protein KPATCC21470_1660 [Kitasatospora purpeofusca]
MVPRVPERRSHDYVRPGRTTRRSTSSRGCWPIRGSTCPVRATAAAPAVAALAVFSVNSRGFLGHSDRKALPHGR